MSLPLISKDVHNTLCFLSAILFIIIIGGWLIPLFRETLKKIKTIQSNERNILILQSNKLKLLRDIVLQNINIHPKQLRRILRTSLESKMVKQIDKSFPDLHINPSFIVCLCFVMLYDILLYILMILYYMVFEIEKW